ncbi:unnamed protein product [Phytomonas sp. Hart1]|nr:unnamed protein product [Phytomonas sp. Hart1]|eukprot:CCW68124.1 unnamed protein product [Phytomonas sp. isolate Hart1]
MVWKFVVLVALACFFIQGWFINLTSAEVLSTSMCDEVHGFAGEYNSNLEIPIQYGTSTTEAVVLIAQSFEMDSKFTTSNWIELNVSYQSTSGKQVMRVSDGYGIIILSDVASPSKLNISVQRLRPDGPAPFRFLSFQANRPTCFIEVSPQNAFMAPLPTILNPGANANPILSTVFFKAQLPDGYSKATIDVTTGLTPTPHDFNMPSPDGMKWDPHRSGDPIEAPPSRLITFSVTPDSKANPLGQATPYLPVSIRTVLANPLPPPSPPPRRAVH